MSYPTTGNLAPYFADLAGLAKEAAALTERAGDFTGGGGVASNGPTAYSLQFSDKVTGDQAPVVAELGVRYECNSELDPKPSEHDDNRQYFAQCHDDEFVIGGACTVTIGSAFLQNTGFDQFRQQYRCVYRGLPGQVAAFEGRATAVCMRGGRTSTAAK